MAQGSSASEAYRNAGYRPNDGNACTLKGHQKISKRVEEIIQESAAIHRAGVAKAIEVKQVTVESILDDLARALAGAEGDKDWKGMVSAAIGQARVAGLMVEKHLVKASHSFDVESLSDEELEERPADVQSRLRQADLELCERARLDPATATLAEFWAAEDEEREEHAARKAREVNPAPPGRGYRPMVQTGRRVKLPKLLNGNGAQNASSVDLRRSR